MSKNSGTVPASWMQRARVMVRGFVLGWWGFTTFCAISRPDFAAALTLFPYAVWSVIGLGAVLVAWSRDAHRIEVALSVLWFVSVGWLSEEPWSLARGAFGRSGAWSAAQQQGEGFRVVSLNCAGGSMEAAREVLKTQPDVVLLQESPPKAKWTQGQVFGADFQVLAGLDGSIAVRGKVTPLPLPPNESQFFALAKVALRSGRELYVVSLRLIPPLFREDLWNPNCWREQTQNRQARRQQLRELVQRLEQSVPHDAPLIVGGDCNAPQGDAVFRLLRPRLHDAFAEGGHGWGNTAINEFPVLRIDQVWLSDHFRAMEVTAQRTQFSDHRMVVCDVIWRRLKGRV